MMANKRVFKSFVPPCPRFLMGGDTHRLCVVCLGAEHAQAVLEGAGCEHCDLLSVKMLCSHWALFEEGASACVTCGSGSAAAEAQRRLLSWGSALSLPSPAWSSASLHELEAHSPVSSTCGEAPVLQCPSSDEHQALMMLRIRYLTRRLMRS